ncbi:MAG: type IV pili methyl-accepting chemotaxis transducer N-terminal domain-containing protein [Rhizobacter sp.]
MAMISCLLFVSPAPGAPALAADLEGGGIHVVGAAERGNLVQEAVRLDPDVVVAHDASPDAAWFDSAALLHATAPRPLVLFTSDPDVEKMSRALECGVAVYVVNGYAAQRLRSLVHLAQARFARERRLRSELFDLSSRFEERKLVDRAKGILMRARQLSEDDAFRLLRTASMQSNQRVGQVSQQLIAAASGAEAVNRAGQLRMLSQRIVKLRALQAAGATTAEPLLAQSRARAETNLVQLTKTLSKSTYGDLLDAVAQSWSLLQAELAAPPDRERLGEVDALAERMLEHADRLVNNLEASGAATRLHVINVCGRQRMLSQRVAKGVLLAQRLRGAAASAAADEADRAGQEFEQALAHLNAAPLSSREIRESLDEAAGLWSAMAKARAKARSLEGQQALGEASEALLALFEQLTERYERSMQMLMG